MKKTKTLDTGITTWMVGKEVKVKTSKNNLHAKCFAPIGVNVQSYFEPENRTNINDFYSKL